MNRRVDITKRPFISRNLAVRMHVPFAEHQQKLFLCKLRIDERQWNTVKRKIPRRVPRVFPFVGH